MQPKLGQQPQTTREQEPKTMIQNAGLPPEAALGAGQ